MKPFWLSKMFWVNLLFGLTMFLTGQEVLQIIPPPYVPYVAAAVFGLNIILRLLTTDALTITRQ